jgi:hypothetical protein
VYAAFELQAREDPRPGDARDRFLVSPDFGLRGADQLEPPAILVGEALVHAQEVAREQGGLVPAGAGPHLEHGGTLVGAILGQELDGERPLGGGQRLLDQRQLLCRHGAQLLVAVAGHGRQAFPLRPKPAHFPRRGRDRFHLRIFLAQPDKGLGGEVTRGHGGGKLLPLGFNLRDPLGRDLRHDRKAACSMSRVTALCSPVWRSLTCAVPLSISASPRMMA